MELLKHLGIHFSQLHPFAFMRVVHFELSCVAVSVEPSVPLFCMFYRLQSGGDWFTFAKRKDSVTLPFCSFMATSTYPKAWKNRFIFVSSSMIPESPPLRDPKATINDSVPVLYANETVLWKRMYEHPTRAYSFPEGILAMGGLSPLCSVRPKAYFGKKKGSLLFASLQCLLIMPWFVVLFSVQSSLVGISFVVGGVVNLEMGSVLEGKTPDVGSSATAGMGEKTPSGEGDSSEGAKALKVPLR
ncbi:hypothetical protein Hanom_Chr13g01194121 [Helianthus anomalus]